MQSKQEFIFTRENWSGDSRDGAVVNGDGYHFFRMTPEGVIVEAYEMYENDDGSEVATPLPEMQNVDWIKDLGFEDLEALDQIEESEFEHIRRMVADQSHP